MLNIYSYCETDKPDPPMQGWWLKNHAPITCSVCKEVSTGWVYVGAEKDSRAVHNKHENHS